VADVCDGSLRSCPWALVGVRRRRCWHRLVHRVRRLSRLLHMPPPTPSFPAHIPRPRRRRTSYTRTTPCRCNSSQWISHRSRPVSIRFLQKFRQLRRAMALSLLLLLLLLSWDRRRSVIVAVGHRSARQAGSVTEGTRRPPRYSE
jgi:hypothetical protein